MGRDATSNARNIFGPVYVYEYVGWATGPKIDVLRLRAQEGQRTDSRHCFPTGCMTQETHRRDCADTGNESAAEGVKVPAQLGLPNSSAHIEAQGIEICCGGPRCSEPRRNGQKGRRPIHCGTPPRTTQSNAIALSRLTSRLKDVWRARRDSNSRPSGSKPDALSN